MKVSVTRLGKFSSLGRNFLALGRNFSREKIGWATFWAIFCEIFSQKHICLLRKVLTLPSKVFCSKDRAQQKNRKTNRIIFLTDMKSCVKSAG
jgi:hypothetical protein